jgi:hypothetical protein
VFLAAEKLEEGTADLGGSHFGEKDEGGMKNDERKRNLKRET